MPLHEGAYTSQLKGRMEVSSAEGTEFRIIYITDIFALSFWIIYLP